MLWESCSKFNLQQLSHSMFCKNIASLAVAMKTCIPWVLAERTIFLRNIQCGADKVERLATPRNLAFS